MPISACSFVKGRQKAWALRRGIAFDGNLRVVLLEENLFEPLGPQALQEFQEADGHELGGGGHQGHMHSLRSSSAAAVNLFHHWQAHGDLAPIAMACRIPAPHAVSLHFEARHPIDGILIAQGATPPNLDVEIRYEGEGPLRAVAFECKFTEPYCSTHGGLRPRYLQDDLAHIWEGIPNLLDLARRLSPSDGEFTYLHAAQLVKHILGLKAGYGRKGFRLVYLWNDAPGPEAVEHAAEVARFQAIAAADSVRVQSLTYQELILRLVEGQRPGHEDYVDYVSGRYL